MLQEPFPDHEPDDSEPDGSESPAAAGNGPQDPGEPGEPDGPEQGLFVCLPAEELSLEGFAQDGRADTMAPGPLLGTVLDAVIGEEANGLAGVSDDQLMGVLSGARRMECRAAWMQLVALAELARRLPEDPVQPVDAWTTLLQTGIATLDRARAGGAPQQCRPRRSHRRCTAQGAQFARRARM